eukprot:Gb_09021 [translate_table: standard]
MGRLNCGAVRAALYSSISFDLGIDLPLDIRATVTFANFLEILGKKYLGGRAHVSNQNDDRRDLQHKVNKLHASTFDDSNKISARAWLQKLQTYFTLSSMVEEDAIQFATLHLEGVAYDWWHGLITQEHNLVQTFNDFSQRLLGRFERKDEEYFRELARIRHQTSVESYVTEFQRVAVMVPNVLERRLTFLSIKGLFKPLKGLVKAFAPSSLQDAIKRALTLEPSTLRSRFSSQSRAPTTGQQRGTFQKGGQQGSSFQAHDEKSLSLLQRVDFDQTLQEDAKKESKYLKQSARSLSQQVSREATFYGALTRLQHNWKVRQKKDHTSGSGGGAGFIIVLSNDALIYPRLSIRLSSVCLVDLDQDLSGTLTANLRSHKRHSLQVRYNHYQSGHKIWEDIRKNSSSILPVYNLDDEANIITQETDRGLAKSIGQGVDEGSKNAHSIFCEILSEKFNMQVFGFLIREINAVKVTGISENFLQISLTAKNTLIVFLESSLSNKDKDSIDVEMTEGHETADEDGKDEGHQMDVQTTGNQNDMLKKSKERCPNPLSFEVYLQQIVHQSIFGLRSSIRDRVMMRKEGATIGVRTG